MMMATDETLEWQEQHVAASRDALSYDLRAAGEEALRQGRPLTESEFSSYRQDRSSTTTPIRRLMYVGGKLAAV